MIERAETAWQYRQLLRYARPYRRGWIAVALVTCASTAMSVLQPWPMKLLVDHVLGEQPLDAEAARVGSMLPGGDTRAGLLGWIAIAGIAIFAINAAMDFVLARSWVRIGQSMVYDVANDAFARAQRRSILFHTRNSVGDLMSRITGDSWCVYKLVDTLLFAPLQALITIAAMLLLMFRMNVQLTLVALAAVPVMTVATTLLAKPLRAVARMRRDAEAMIQSHVHQTLSGIPVVQAFNQEERERNRFEEHVARAIRAHGRNLVLSSVSGLASGLLPVLATAAVLWFGARDVLRGELTLGALLVFLAYLRSLQGSAAKLTSLYATLQESNASADRIFELIMPEPEVRESPGAIVLPARARGRVEFHNVTFGYDLDRPVLRNLNLTLEPGQTVAIVGGTGAGKSTLANLIPRLLDPWSGHVLFDARDVRELNLRSLRANVSLVLQEPFLFPLTIAQNIALGRPDATAAQIEAAALAAGAHDFIARLPQEYQTTLGERGATLSGGERQRLSIARALLRDAPVLILDEPTSALDTATEASILSVLRSSANQRTTLMIAHRLSTVRHADRIIVLERGAVIEEGTHDELLRRGGIFANLYHAQMSEPRHPAVPMMAE